MNKLIFPVLLIISIALTSCTVVEWENPISSVEETVGDVRLPGAWGLKNPETGTIRDTLFIGKPVDGWMSFCYWMETRNEIIEGFGKMFVSKIDRRTFLNFRMVDQEGKLSNSYGIVEYEVRKGKLQLYYPHGIYVKKARQDGWISAEDFGNEGLLIRGSSKETREFIKNSPRGRLFRTLGQPLTKFR
jgi:hypothetical protein